MEFPHIQEIWAEHGGDDFVVLSVETTNRPELARAFVEKYGATFPVAMDEEKSARETFELVGVPTTLMIDRQGNVIFRHLGFSEGNEEMFKAELEILLNHELETASRGTMIL